MLPAKPQQLLIPISNFTFIPMPYTTFEIYTILTTEQKLRFFKPSILHAVVS